MSKRSAGWRAVRSRIFWFLYHGLDGFMYCAWKKQIKKFVAFPMLTPLRPDANAQSWKQASLSDHPHPSGLPTGRRKATKQNSCPWQYKISLHRRLPTITLDLWGAYPLAILFSTTDKTNRTEHWTFELLNFGTPLLGARQQPGKPLGEVGGLWALLLCLRLGLIRASS